MSTSLLLLVDQLTTFYGKKLLNDHYALTYLDNNYYSLAFIGVMLCLVWGVLITAPIHIISWVLYFVGARKSSSLNSSSFGIDDDDEEDVVGSSGFGGQKQPSLKKQIEKSRKFGKVFNVLTSVSSFVWCLFASYFLVLVSTFSRAHYILTALVITIMWSVWLINSFVLDLKWIIVMIYYRLVKKVDLTSVSTSSSQMIQESQELADDGEALLEDNSSGLQRRPQSSSKLDPKKAVTVTRSLLLDSSKPYISRKPILAVILIVIATTIILIVSVMTTFIFADICIAYDPIEISTHFTRTVLSNGKCERDTVCYSYLTVPEKMDHQMIVNFQLYTYEFYKGFVEYKRFDPADEDFDPKDVEFNEYHQASCFKLDNIEEESRYQCFAELTDLKPGSSYILRAGYSASESTDAHDFHYDNEYLKFRTIPSEDDSSKIVSFINGGDLAWRGPTYALSKAVNTLGYGNVDNAPYFAIVGGDIAYENGCAYCYRRWDDWFLNWNKFMKTTVQYDSDNSTIHQYTLPILTTVGNHEGGNFKRPRSDDAFYIRLFPMSISGATEKIVSDPQTTRKLQHVHYLSKHTMIVALDSWVHESPQDQIEYLTNLFEKSVTAGTYKNRFIIIHHPMYTSGSVGDIDKEMIAKWESLFQKYGITAVFENHVHTYKQTYPIRDGKVVTKTSEQTDSTSVAFSYKRESADNSKDGIMYFGDGSWGVTYWNASLRKSSGLFRQIGVLSHVYHVKCRSLSNAISFTELYALGYNSTTGAVSEFGKSRVRIEVH
ncbi:hypothetical protein NAEGRDRAFT_78752 [Naegleria gruberi]|uniref:Uncharacterized protein n=1 Tax=Naegleria gruberi TaxID=5762 RepID=D2V691_NAEGR|nr:uncharacterized protein NAEGRDRAFT_78752 [Naegleria gruberi]EFC47796.1 hypothetical protein NAEGRDRAFT_78752 [Naegleria gruberi]|eukprot:XP_002680540.1 hypothetical protein NAEGRDRAFT_78752 [Naegleria gruberi strain NEG-M]